MHRPSMMLNQPWQSNNWLVTNTKSIANHNLNKLIQPHQDSGNWIVSFSCSFLLKFFWSHFYKFLAFLKKGLAWSFHSFSSFVLNGECIVLCDAFKRCCCQSWRSEDVAVRPSSRLRCAEWWNKRNGSTGPVGSAEKPWQKSTCYVCLGDKEEIIVFINILLCQKYGSFCGKLTVWYLSFSL